MKLEADFTQYYNSDLRDLFKPDSPMTVRWVVDHMEMLPDGSRIHKHLTNDAFDVDQHILASIYDALNQLTYQASISASAAAGKEYKKLVKGAPKPIERPTVFEKPKQKKKFARVSEIKKLLETRKRVIIHTEACIKSGVNKGGGDIRCGCPVEPAKKRGGE